MTLYLLDNSVYQRLGRHPEVVAAVDRLLGRGDLLASSDVSRLEAAFSARSPKDYGRIVTGLRDETLLLGMTEAVGEITGELQDALAIEGKWRAVGVVDLLHAATAIVHDAVVVHYDADFELLSELDGRLRQEWVVPKGSID
ncbi:PIN domain-containing protein [Nocardioides speluncae]|uniref:PIN domain-containing protein n=1 Tax=Nocardioides speluncae TaxID=2670337 RepID=UPI000D68E0C3|nr:PIN domain-containing protein [Nocardioides speluncae]